MLAGMINGHATGFESLPFAQRRSRNWIPEPLRWLVVRHMQSAYERIDLAAEAGRARPWDASITEFLGKH
jgi:hypothetical protein